MTESEQARRALQTHLRPGDLITWGQACGEPRTLTDALVAVSREIAGLRCFIGIPADSAITRECDAHLEVHSYCGAGTNAGLHADGRLQVWPVHYSTLPDLLTTGALHADVVLVQVSPPDERGRHSLGLGDDYFSAAVDHARVVIAEINDQVPFTPGARTLVEREWTAAVRTSRPPGELATPVVTDELKQVARQVASVVPDGATLQFGIGALPEAVLAELTEHNDLGIHSGIINDTAMTLVESGVANGRLKTHDRGVAVAGLLGGTKRLFSWAHQNPAVALRATAYTHDPHILATSRQLVAINAAIEVDLTGQVNAETAGERYVGAVGGAVDFLRGAARSPGGVPIVALPSTHAGTSRIVRRLSGPVSTPRSEPLVVITEHGVADLRGVPVERRADLLVAIAHPDHRDALRAAQPTPVFA